MISYVCYVMMLLWLFEETNMYVYEIYFQKSERNTK